MRRLAPGDPALAQVLALIRQAFAFMDGRIDPPSSMHRLTLAALDRQAADAEVWTLGDPPVACVILTPMAGALHVGKLAVARAHRNRGLARRLIDHAETRARALGLPALELQVRIELTENQTTFTRLGFSETARTAHPGHDRPTSLTLRCNIGPGPG